MIYRSLSLFLVLVLYSLAPARVLATVARCDAPAPASRLIIDSPTCDQRWSYHLYRLLAIRWTTAARTAFDSEEFTALKTRQQVKMAASIAGAFFDIYRAKGLGMKAFNASFTPTIYIDLLPIDGTAEEVGVQMIDLTIYAMKQIALRYTTNPTLGMPFEQSVKISADFAATWVVDNVVEKRNGHNIAQQYLRGYYRFGGDERLVASSYGLSPDAPLKRTIDTVAKSMGYRSRFLGKEYDVDEIAKQIVAFQRVIASNLEQVLREGNPREIYPGAKADESATRGSAITNLTRQDDLAEVRAKYQQDKGALHAVAMARWNEARDGARGEWLANWSRQKYRNWVLYSQFRDGLDELSVVRLSVTTPEYRSRREELTEEYRAQKAQVEKEYRVIHENARRTNGEIYKAIWDDYREQLGRLTEQYNKNLMAARKRWDKLGG